MIIDITSILLPVLAELLVSSLLHRLYLLSLTYNLDGCFSLLSLVVKFLSIFFHMVEFYSGGGNKQSWQPLLAGSI